MKTYSFEPDKIWTVSDYMGIGISNEPVQLIHGKLIMSPAPSPQHQRISRNLFQILIQHTVNFGEVFYSPIDLILSESIVLQPDLVFISNKKKEIITNRGIEGIPDLIVEVISPSNSYIDRVTKKEIYTTHGIPELWLVDPQSKRLEIYLPQTAQAIKVYKEDEVVMAETLPNLSFILSSIFE
ncbi:MAG: Uma2 family endonuclease [Cyclobacteriaceae bacterium]|nr:Uma2 family endonuclease [Cyclobacteriaceae bacterium]